METVVDKECLRNTLIHLVKNEPDFVRQLLFEINEDLKKARAEKLEKIIGEDFKEYESVFRALA